MMMMTTMMMKNGLETKADCISTDRQEIDKIENSFVLLDTKEANRRRDAVIRGSLA
jgi:hypothetical protein